MKCPVCGRDNREAAGSCEGCGQSLIVDRVCPQCGQATPQASNSCDKCGYPFVQLAPDSDPSPTPSRASTPTSFAGGRYVLKKSLGEGGMKKVYLARDTLLDRDVALALIKNGGLEEENRSRFVREAKVLGHLGQHPNIVSVYDLGQESGQLYMVTELMAGEDVEAMLGKSPERRLSIEQCIDIARSVCRALVVVHSRGIIHRDLKPGNVYLNTDGTVKIGDFGLAFGLDLSRMTRSGMTLGTVSYMTPEQAMGLQPTPQADLYSLGAMLYEMLTGRPPFTGDTVVSVIGQHINTPPVSPAWHRHDIPAALETLVMQLLEKNPEKRPESAGAVLEALKSIENAKARQEPPKANAAAEDPLYRRVFVGRQAELKRLQSAFDAAMSGQGTLMMVAGEPGIGKTALCEQLATYVTLRGGQTLVGRCYEEGSLSLPYLAFVEAMRAYVLSRDVKDLRAEIGTAAADLGRIVPEIRERLKVKLRPKKDAEEDRYRLMHAVSSFLATAAVVRPILILLEDLHDADRGTLEMLIHVSRYLAGTRILVVGTYRDVEMGRSHPLSAALAELRRVSSYRRVLLRGLNADEVRRMLESIARQSVPPGLAEAVHRQTEGNPLFAQEVVRFLAEEGLITRKGGGWRTATDIPIEMSIPEGLRDVIGKRLSLLSKKCNQLLSIASVAGREFGIETLRAVAGIGEDILVEALKEAVSLSVLEEIAEVGLVRYRFTHAFFRQILYEETIAPQRMKLHGEVARSLETSYVGRLEEHAAELAEHFSRSADPDDLRKAVSYGEMAARRAVDVYAHGEAVRLLDQAIKVQKVVGPDDKPKLCDLVLNLCDVLLDVPDTARVLAEEAPAAFSLADSTRDDRRAVRACWAALFSIMGEQAGPGYSTPQWVEWSERADRYARPDTLERARVDFAFGCTKCRTDEKRTGVALLIRALEFARRAGDQELMILAGTALIQYRSAPHHTAETVHLVEELWASRTGVRRFVASPALSLLGHAFLSIGQRRRAEEAFGELRLLAARAGDFRLGLASAAMDAILAVIDGRLAEATQTVEHMLARGEEVGAPGSASQYASLAAIRSSIYVGTFVQQSTRTSDAAACLQLVYAGKKEAASEELEKRVVKRPSMATLEDETRFSVDTVYLEASVLLGHRRAAELLLNRLSGSGLCTTGIFFPTCIARHLGAAAALLGRYDEARQHYREAINVCTEMGFRPELALTRLEFAELLLEQYPHEKKDALEHLDFATREFREMKMRPSLERALAHEGDLKS